jgi:hypothetical protein
MPTLRFFFHLFREDDLQQRRIGNIALVRPQTTSEPPGSRPAPTSSGSHRGNHSAALENTCSTASCPSGRRLSHRHRPPC